MYRQIKVEVLQKFAKPLVKAKGKANYVGLDKQCEILENCYSLSSSEFVNYFTDLLKEITRVPDIYVGHEALPNLSSKTSQSGQVFPTTLQPEDFRETRPQNAISLYQAWYHSVGVDSASNEGFWCSITLNELERGVIGAPWWLLAGREEKHEETIKPYVDEAISKKSEKKIDDLIRRLVRNMAAGAYVYRGQRALFSNCPLARTFWIGKLASIVSATELEVATILAVPKIWGEFADQHFTKKKFQIHFESDQSVAIEGKLTTVIDYREKAMITDAISQASEILLKAA